MVSISGRRMAVVSRIEVGNCLFDLASHTWLCSSSRLGAADSYVDCVRRTARASTAQCGDAAKWASKWACGGLESVESGDVDACGFAE